MEGAWGTVLTTLKSCVGRSGLGRHAHPSSVEPTWPEGSQHGDGESTFKSTGQPAQPETKDKSWQNLCSLQPQTVPSWGLVTRARTPGPDWTRGTECEFTINPKILKLTNTKSITKSRKKWYKIIN